MVSCITIDNGDIYRGHCSSYGDGPLPHPSFVLKAAKIRGQADVILVFTALLSCLLIAANPGHISAQHRCQRISSRDSGKRCE
jgi:hypothetical protein